VRTAGLGVIGLAASCKTPPPSDDPWCEEPLWTDDATPGCVPTADDIEGPYYLPDSPERADLDLYGDAGEALTLTGRVLESDCATPINGAVVEVWQADPNGEYDNSSADRRYRGFVATAADGTWTIRTLKPGWYLNGAHYRPAHVHFKVSTDGVERLTTQLYFEGDPYLSCDAFANTSLVRPVVDGTLTFDIVLA
jgi:protocatechuate 3,4-dioxygenase beta subunit